jgi:hypothetical protein
MFVASRCFPVRHGFSTRVGGVSHGPFASLNLSRSVGDEPERVEENLRRLAREASLGPGQLVCVNQVHGEALVEVASAARGDALPPVLGDADGLYTRSGATALCVRTADCVPLLLFAPDVGAVAAVHAGWRGAIAGIARLAVDRLVACYGARAARMHAAIGPSIRRCCYEVSDELAARFCQRFGEGVVGRGGGAPHLDIAQACRLALLEGGVEAERIDLLPHCTSCDAAAFFSHRRDRGRTGRHLSFVAL